MACILAAIRLQTAGQRSHVLVNTLDQLKTKKAADRSAAEATDAKKRCLVQSHNEWDPVEEIIVGSAKHARIPHLDLGFEVTAASADDLLNVDIKGKYPQKIIDETEEDIERFVEELEKLGIRVRRPSDIALNNFATPDWKCDAFFSYCPRDTMLVIGDTVIETPNTFRSRYFESIVYKEILLEYFKSGAKWITAPKPRLLDVGYNRDKQGDELSLNNCEPVFDAANVIRAGKDLFFQLSDSGNKLGLQWLAQTIGDAYHVHAIPSDIYSSVHIDSTLCLLKPGLLLANPERVDVERLPSVLRQWEIVWAPEMVEYQYSEVKPISSKWLGNEFIDAVAGIGGC